MSFIKDFWKENKTGYLISGIVISIGSFFLSYLYKGYDFILSLPFIWGFLFCFSLIFALFLGGGN